MFSLQLVLSSLLLVFTSAFYEGDNCTLSENGQSGNCTSLLNCEYAKTLLSARKTPQTCGFNSQVPLVCCPFPEKIKTIAPESRSIEKCKEYHNVTTQKHGISNGLFALPREFPHMAALGYGDKNNIFWLCGATLISEKFVLTAAHCIYSHEFGKVKWVRLGDLDLKNTTEDANPQDKTVIRTIPHPDYKPPSHYHDIALLEFDEPALVRLFHKPACLQIERRLPLQVQATGWGKTGYSEEPSSHLMKVFLDVVGQEQCAEDYVKISVRKLARGILDEFQICAGDLLGEGKDTCPGDSGGPLHYFVEATKQYVKHYVIVGVTSFGKTCGLGSPGVYTRVSAYVGWIEDIVWPVST